MSSKLKAIGLAGAVATAATAGMVALVPGTANAASYNGVCGSSYSVIDSHALSNKGTIFLTYSGSTGRNCVVTVRNSSGAATSMGAEVSLAGAPWNVDSGNYTSYAGPVYVAAAHHCIDWGGWIGSTTWAAYSVHCG